jgi:D-sedoheptulose 7-phosphate isomerase
VTVEPSTDLDARAAELVRGSLFALDALAEDREAIAGVARLAEAVSSALARGGKVWLFGNGGSAATAQHFAAELVGHFKLDRRPLPAEALTANSSVVTALANDYGFEQVFARQLEAGASTGDVAIGISTSGRSPNVVEGLAAARRLGLFTAALTGGDGGELAGPADVSIVAPAADTAHIQECHAVVAHVLCELVESALPESG